MEGKSVFEILDFVLDPKKTHFKPKGIDFDYKNANIGILESREKILATQYEENQIISIHNAALFSAYYGMPRDEKRKTLWKGLSFSEKVAQIKNDLNATGSISFTKIL